MTSIRLLLSIAAAECLTLYQWDIKQAFLSAKLPYAVYVEPPEGLKDEGWVWLLRRALYGLHEASSLFGAQLSETLVMRLGLKKMRADQCVYMWKRPRGSGGKHAILILTTWVDDLIIGASDTAIKVEFYDALSRFLDVKDLGPIKWCLGINVVQDPDTFDVTLTQEAFITELLERAGLGGDIKTKKTPGQPNLTLRATDQPEVGSEAHREMQQHPYSLYRSLVGSIMYLASCTRPDIAVVSNFLARYSANPGKPHWNALIWCLRYLAGTKTLGITYHGKKTQSLVLEDEVNQGHRVSDDDLPSPRLISESYNSNLVVFVDSDWGACVDTRRSTGGCVIFMNGALVFFYQSEG